MEREHADGMKRVFLKWILRKVGYLTAKERADLTQEVDDWLEKVEKDIIEKYEQRKASEASTKGSASD